jgi:hypothetical protein
MVSAIEMPQGDQADDQPAMNAAKVTTASLASPRLAIATAAQAPEPMAIANGSMTTDAIRWLQAAPTGGLRDAASVSSVSTPLRGIRR